MRIRRLDKKGDWSFGHGQTDYARGEASILLDVQMRLKEWFRDCFFALQNGIPWSVRLGSHNQKQLLDRDIQNVITGTQGILNITNFESTVSNRHYRAVMTIYTEYSPNGSTFTFDTQI